MTRRVLHLYEFLELTQKEQFDLLHNEGVHVGKRKVAGQTVILMQLNSFYVEVYYRKYRKVIDRIITSESTDILQAYLSQINIRGITGNKDEL